MGRTDFFRYARIEYIYNMKSNDKENHFLPIISQDDLSMIKGMEPSIWKICGRYHSLVYLNNSILPSESVSLPLSS